MNTESKPGSSRPRGRLTKDDVVAIRAAIKHGGVSQDELADGYGVSRRTIQNAAYGDQWSDVPGRLKPPPRGSWLRGEKSPNAKLNEDQVRQIRRMHGRWELADIAERFNVSVWTVDLICRGVLWKHLADHPDDHRAL